MSTEPLSPMFDALGFRQRLFWRSVGGLLLVALVIAIAVSLRGFWRPSDRPEDHYQRGRQALLAGDRKTVFRESKALSETVGFESHGRLLTGLFFLQQGHPEKALPELVKASEGEALTVEAMTAAARCYYTMGRFKDAVSTALVVLSKDSEAIDARRWLAAAYYDLGATGNAAAELEKISMKAPHDARSKRLLGLIAKDTERFDEAVSHYRESLRRNPFSADRQSLLTELAESLIKLSRFDEAKETLKECDRTAQNLTFAAECAQNLGQSEDAQTQYREAIKLEPTYVPARVKLGALLLMLGRVEDSTDALKEAVHLAPESSQAHFHLAQAFARQGERSAADEELRLMQQLQTVEREFAQLHERASGDLGDADARFRIGLLANQLHKPELARLWFRAALALDPRHTGAVVALRNTDLRLSRP